MNQDAWAGFRSGMLRRLEFDALFGAGWYARPDPETAEPAPATVEPPPAPEGDYSPSEVAGIGLPVPQGLADREAALARLRQFADACTACSLHQTRTRGVFGVGPAGARLMVIGEAPGYNEDQQGEPFVGPAGELLDRQLEVVLHLKRSEVYIANVLKCRPPNNRDPQPAERLACKPYLARQIQLIGPELILAVGKHAACWLLDVEQSIGRMRGRLHDYMGVPVIVTYHPAFLLRQERNSEWHRKVWDDLKRARDHLGLKQPGDKD